MKRKSDVVFELVVHDERKLFSIFFRPSGRWQYVEYYPDGSVSERVDMEADEFMRRIDEIRGERTA